MKWERLLISEAVARALAAHRPVVALETTVVTHGLPQPQSMRVAIDMEERVREAGAEPATIGILDGRVHVGISAADLLRLASTPNVPKLNLSNLAGSLISPGVGSTTVAATMLVALHAGIGVFATGGIGGVHRGASETDDVSADLTALARFPVTVVCSGAKSILDLPRTVERLETAGVPIYGYRTEHFPAFWRRSSGIPVDQRFDALAQLAEAIREHHALGTGTGVLVANPVPEAEELREEDFERALEGALKSVASHRIRGRAVTPHMLEHMQRSGGGQLVTANVALLESNAHVASEIAVALSRL